MPLTLTQTVAPTQEPVSLVEVKQHLRISHDDEDALLYLYLQAAREAIERATRRQFLSATFTLSLDDFPMCEHVRLPRAPLQSVTSVSYLDTNGDAQTLSTEVYGVDTISEPGRVYLKYNQTWPSTYSQPLAVTITYVAGWATYSQVPPTLKMAILLLTGHMYENREASAEKMLHLIPMGLQHLLWIQRVEVL